MFWRKVRGPRRQFVVPARLVTQPFGLFDDLAGSFERDTEYPADSGVSPAVLAQRQRPLAQCFGAGFAADAPFCRGRCDGDAGVHPYCKPEREKFLYS